MTKDISWTPGQVSSKQNEIFGYCLMLYRGDEIGLAKAVSRIREANNSYSRVWLIKTADKLKLDVQRHHERLNSNINQYPDIKPLPWEK